LRHKLTIVHLVLS